MVIKINNYASDCNCNTEASGNYKISPCELFSVAGSISLLLYNNLTFSEIETLNNLIDLISANLSAMITQCEINAGEQIQEPLS